LGASIWSVRNIPLLGPAILKLPIVPGSLKEYAKDVPTELIKRMANVNWIGDNLFEVVKAADESYFAKKGIWLSRPQMQRVLESYRKQDMEVYLQKSGPALLTRHFRPPNIMP
jgi:hypothetical protein